MSHHIDTSTGPKGFIISLILMAFGAVAPHTNEVVQQVLEKPVEIPTIYMQIGQWIAWGCVVGTFVMTVYKKKGRKK